MAEIIAVQMASLVASHRACVSGLRRYRDREQLDWDIVVAADPSHRSAPTGAWWLGLHKPGSIVDRAKSPNLPIGAVFPAEQHPDVHPVAELNNPVFGLLAARHLHEFGYQRCVSLNSVDKPHLADRVQGFEEECQRLGVQTDRFVPEDGLTGEQISEQAKVYLLQQQRPFGVYGSSDANARWVRAMCEECGLVVGEDVAIVGTGDIPRYCLSHDPELSSVAFPWIEMGEAAGKFFHHYMKTGQVLPPTEVTPFQVAVRGSTGSVQVTDPLVEEALVWLQDNLDCAQPSAGLAEALQTSVPTVCRHFKHALAASPKQVHDRLRLQYALTILADPRQRIDTVARSSGFSSSTAFGVAFRRRYGCTPTQWRDTLYV